MAMDNMTIRKAQLEKLDDFVHTLYQETQTFKQYGVDLKDLEILYLHIHELIEELLQCNTTDEFMAMIEQLHKAIAGVLIVAIPKGAEQVMKDFADAHGGDGAMDLDKFVNNLKGRSSSLKPDEPEVENDPDELVDILDLGKHVNKNKPKAKWNLDEVADQEEVSPPKNKKPSLDDDEDPSEEEVPKTKPKANGDDPFADMWN